MKVLVGCEYSGVVRDAFIRAGHDAHSCDLLPSESDKGPHHQMSVLRLFEKDWEWDLAIFHPPCTYLCNSGVRWLYKGGKKGAGYNTERWQDMTQGADFFVALRRIPIPRICIENPVMHKYAKSLVRYEFSQSIQPWQFGHGECKRTCLWLKNLPDLQPTDVVDGRGQSVARCPPGADRWKFRSRTFTGIAEAMADQWGSLPVIKNQSRFSRSMERKRRK